MYGLVTKIPDVGAGCTTPAAGRDPISDMMLSNPIRPTPAATILIFDCIGFL